MRDAPPPDPAPERLNAQLAAMPAATAVVTMPAEVDFSNAWQVRANLVAAFAPGVSTVIADFTPTLFWDSSGVREVVRAYKLAIAEDVAFRVVVQHPYLMALLTRTGLVMFLPVYPSLDQALHDGTAPQQPET